MTARRLLASAAVFCFFHFQAVAQACEGCKSSMSEGTAAEDSGLGFAISTYLMLATPLLLVGGIAFMAYRNIRKIDQARAAEAADLAHYPASALS
jgi:hypothetical protein